MLNYSSVNEDWRTEATGLQLRDRDRVLCVTGGGARPLDLLAVAPARIVAIDSNPVQNHLLRLKMAAMTVLSFQEFAAFVGLCSADPRWRRDTMNRLAPELSAAARVFWADHMRLVDKGVLYLGRFERYFRRVSRLAHVLRSRVLDTLFCFDDLQAQQRFVSEHWDAPLWRLTFRALCNPVVSRIFYGDPAYFAHTAMPVGPYLYKRMQAVLMRCLARNNFMVTLVLRGQLTPFDLPPHLTPEGFRRIRHRVDRLEVVDSDLITLMNDPSTEPFTRFSLSDVPSFLNAKGFGHVLQGVLRTSAPKARLVLRQFLGRYQVPQQVSGRIIREPELEARLAKEDHAFAYDFIIGEVRHEDDE